MTVKRGHVCSGPFESDEGSSIPMSTHDQEGPRRPSRRDQKSARKAQQALERLPEIRQQVSQTGESCEPKKRGRRVTEASVYDRDSQAKIDDWRRTLANGHWDSGRQLTKKDREGLRNRISAQISRRNKKMEMSELQVQTELMQRNFGILLAELDRTVNEADKERLVKSICEKIPDKTSAHDVPHKNSFTATLKKFMEIA